MRYRLAKVSDASQLAAVHHRCARDEPGSVFVQLGRFFLRQYYRIVLPQKFNVTLCAENDRGEVVGFMSGSIDYSQHVKALRKARFRLALSALPALLRRPRILWGLLSRRASLIGSAEGKHVTRPGPRVMYWAMLPEARAGANAFVLQEKWLALVRLLGCREVEFDVDGENRRVENFHRARGAEVLEELNLPDGRKRIIMRYVLDRPSQRSVDG
jgi:hypothetical protein